MTPEKLNKGNALQTEIKRAFDLKENYQKLLKIGLRKDYQDLLDKDSRQIRVCLDKEASPKINDIFHEEAEKFLEIMETKIDKHIRALELEFKNLTAE